MKHFNCFCGKPPGSWLAKYSRFGIDHVCFRDSVLRPKRLRLSVKRRNFQLNIFCSAHPFIYLSIGRRNVNGSPKLRLNSFVLIKLFDSPCAEIDGLVLGLIWFADSGDPTAVTIHSVFLLAFNGWCAVVLPLRL